MQNIRKKWLIQKSKQQFTALAKQRREPRMGAQEINMSYKVEKKKSWFKIFKCASTTKLFTLCQFHFI